MSGKTKLTVRWSKAEDDLMIDYPRQKADGHYLAGVLDGMREELARRGYDITTLRISVDSARLGAPGGEKA